MKYRKKPIVIEAVQWTGLNPEDVHAFVNLGCTNGRVGEICQGFDINIHTLEGTMKADVGDFIVRGTKGELYPCKPDIFAATYELAE